MKTEARWEKWARRIAPLVHDGLIDTQQAGREIPDKAFYLARLLDEHLAAEARPTPVEPEARTIIEALAGEEPISQDEMGGCVWCGGTPRGSSGYGHATAHPSSHSDDCAWIAARRFLARAKSGLAVEPDGLPLDVERNAIIARLVKWGTNPDLPEGPNPPITPEGFDNLRSIIRDAARLASTPSEAKP